jgi:hypothetical protein
MGYKKVLQCRLLAVLFAALSVAQVATSHTLASNFISFIFSGESSLHFSF